MSSTLNHLAQHLALAAKRVPLQDTLWPGNTHVRRAGLLAVIWTAFVVGALLAGVATPSLAVGSLAIPLLILIVLAASIRSN